MQDYYLIQILDNSETRSERYNELTFCKVIDLDYYIEFGEYDEDDNEIEEASICFRQFNTPVFPYRDYVRKDSKESYNLIKCQVEFYKNGNLKKCSLKATPKIRCIPSGKTRKNESKRTKRMVRG